MRECWNYIPHERPNFSEIVEHLDRILSVTANEEYLDLGLPQLETPPSRYLKNFSKNLKKKYF